MGRNTTTVDLPFDLTDDEVRERGLEQARLLQQRTDLDVERKEKAKAYKDEIEALDEKVGELSQVITSGRELRPVVCEWVANHPRAVMDLVRTDYGTVVQSRPMTEHEKQRAMFDVAASPAVERAMQDLHDAVPEGGSIAITTPDGKTTKMVDKTAKAAGDK
jgi:predicted RNA-binding protein